VEVSRAPGPVRVLDASMCRTDARNNNGVVNGS
jgi:hypothetical protein